MSRKRRLSFDPGVSLRRVLALGCGLGLVSWSQAEEKSVAEAISEEVRAVFHRNQNAVVRIEAVDGHGALSGTGFFIDPNGTVFTSYTIGGESQAIMICFGGQKLPARRLVGDPRSGVAILKVDAETPFLALGKARELSVASPVMTIGYPMDLPVSPSFGTVGGFDIKWGGRYFATTHIRANIHVQRGEGGAPLLNLRGEVVGVLISDLDRGNAAFALPIEAAQKVHKEIMQFGELRPGWLGMGVHSATKAEAGSTAQVDAVIPGAPAEEAGVLKGDYLVAVGELPITSTDDVWNAAFFTTAENVVTLRVWRGGEILNLTANPTDHPKSTYSAPKPPHLQGLPASQPNLMAPPAGFPLRH